MCYFLTIGIPRSHIAWLENHDPAGLDVTPAENPSLAKIIGREFEIFIAVSGQCSCSLYHSANVCQAARNRLEKRREKYIRQGWSEEKILRAIGPKRRVSPIDFAGLRDDARRWLVQVAETCGQVGVVIHFYNGTIADEIIDIAAQQHMNPNQFLDAGAILPEDTLVWLDARREQAEANPRKGR